MRSPSSTPLTPIKCHCSHTLFSIINQINQIIYFQEARPIERQKRDRNGQKHRNTLRITRRQKDRQKKANYIYKLQANYINYTNTVFKACGFVLVDKLTIIIKNNKCQNPVARISLPTCNKA